MIAVLAAILAVGPVMAQKSDPKGTKTPPMKQKPPMKAMEEKFSGGVAKANFKFPSFEVGVSAGAYKGKRITVDASKAMIMDKAGKKVMGTSIMPGTSVTVFGKVMGMKVTATKIQVNSMMKPTPMKGGPKGTKPQMKKGG